MVGLLGLLLVGGPASADPLEDTEEMVRSWVDSPPQDVTGAAYELINFALGQACDVVGSCTIQGIHVAAPWDVDPKLCEGIHTWIKSGMYGIMIVEGCGRGLFTGLASAEG